MTKRRSTLLARHAGWAALLAAAALALACETPPTNSQEHFGEATRMNRQTMIESGRTADGTPREPQSIDGTTAAGISRNYHENEQAETQRTRTRNDGITTVGDM